MKKRNAYNNLEISKMLTVSNAHLTQDDVRYLEWVGNSNSGDLVTYKKSFCGIDGEEVYGWFVYVPDDLNELRLSENLKCILTFAKSYECDWICFDRDGCVIKELDTYDW